MSSLKGPTLKKNTLPLPGGHCIFTEMNLFKACLWGLGPIKIYGSICFNDPDDCGNYKETAQQNAFSKSEIGVSF